MIIVSITGPTASLARQQVRASERYADLIEFRLDLLGGEKALDLLRVANKPVIATCRSEKEGGAFRGTENERWALLRAAAHVGAAYVDVELDVAERMAAFRAEHPKTRIILSHHDVGGVLRDASALFERMKQFDPYVMKLAYTAHDAGDITRARTFLTFARRHRRRAVAVAMGEFGEATRVLFTKFGGWATYAAPDRGAVAAPGQISASVVTTVYRVRRIDAATKVYGVIGNPLVQSKGVLLHNPLFKKYGVNAVYCRFPVIDVGSFMQECAPLLHGFSVTIPHKQTVLPMVDEVDEPAAAIGAVNTVLRKRGKWFGTNTDAAGALDAMETKVRVKGKHVLVLGAGGAARAIVFEARRRGAVVFVANRTEERARRVADEFGCTFVPMSDLAATDFDIFANATSVGMVPHVDSSPVPKAILRNKVVFDVVYNPPITKLLREARRVGAVIVPGTEMYINQAAMQFGLYTGIRPARAVLRKVLFSL